jgi:valyl-tRNA synthetase
MSAPDLDKQRAKLDKDITGAQAHAARLQAKLSNADFTAKAPAQVVERERQALAEAQDRLARLQEQRQRLG